MPGRPEISRVATDVGGTFTDLVYSEIDSFGRQIIRIAKTNTTPPNFEQGILDVLAKGEVDIPTLGSFAHGTTVVINALTERKGVKTALIATAGFGDVLEIGRGNRPCFFNLFYEKPKSFVPAELRREVAGRMSYRGEELAPVDLSSIPAIVADFRGAGVQAVAVCLLHSYANPAHERAVVDAVKREWPSLSIVASHQITREWREYERSSTTVLSAFVQPIAERYLERLEQSLTSRGYRGPLYIMQSNCGVDSLAATKAIPITMVESGPASGMWAAAELGRAIGEPNVLALDIGGTTAKTSLIEDGNVRIKTDYWIERDRQRAGYPIMAPVVDLVELGNGGGSIAAVDEFGKLHVGPRSAGAEPGPAAYRKGGLDATTTDANLALGRISSDYFCGGEIVADMAAVDAALTRLGKQLGLSAIEVARGIVRIANNNMINALKLVSLNRGHDPREFALVAFGGGGGMHAAALGAELGCQKVVVPRGASVFSAWGMMMSDLRRDYFVTRLIDTDETAPAALAALLEETQSQANAAFKAEGIASDRLRARPLIRCRYQNQEHAVEIPLTGERIDGTAVTRLIEDFHIAHEREYSYRLTAPVEIVGLHLVATAEIEKLSFAEQPVSGRPLAALRKIDRVVDFSEQGRHTTAIYDATALEPGMVIVGPAILEDPGTTIVIHPGNRATLDRFGNIHIDLGKGATA
jgi:N-methylhydantoinase A